MHPRHICSVTRAGVAAVGGGGCPPVVGVQLIHLIDYEFDLDTGTPSGVSRIDFVITLSNQAAAQYQALNGTFSVVSYAKGQNLLDPGEAPLARPGQR